MKLPTLNQSGVAHLALIILVLASIAVSTVLVQERTQINSRADDWYRDEEPQEEAPEPEPEPEPEEPAPEEPQEPQPDPEPEPPQEPEPENTPEPEPENTPEPEQPEETPPQGGEEPETPTPPKEEEIIDGDPVDEEDPGLFENLKDSLLDVTDSLGLTDPQKEHEEEIENAEDEGTKIKNRLVAALNDPENADKNKSDLKEELGLDPQASDDELFVALRTAWSEKGITVSGDSFEEFTVYTGQGELVALANTGVINDATDVAMGLGTGCAGSSLGVAQAQLVCGPSDFNLGPSKSVVGSDPPDESQLEYCNTSGGFQSNCKPVPEQLPECNDVGGYQGACVQKPRNIPVCNRSGGMQEECIFNTADLPVCADQGFQSNCIYVPKPEPQPAINPACLDPKKFLDPACVNGGTGPVTSKAEDTLGRQTPIVIIDEETEDTTEKDRLARARSSTQPIIDESQAKIDEIQQKLIALERGEEEGYVKEIERLQKELEGLQSLQGSPGLSPAAEKSITSRITLLEREIGSAKDIRTTELEQEQQRYKEKLKESQHNLKLAEGRYIIKQDPEVQAKTREFNRAGDEFLARGQTDTQRNAAEERLIKAMKEKTELEDRKLLEWLQNNH